MFITRCLTCNEYSDDENILDLNIIEYLITGQKHIRRVNNYPNFAVIINAPNHPTYDAEFYSYHSEHNLIIIEKDDPNEMEHRNYNFGWNCT